MIDPKRIAEMDQAVTGMVEVLPSLWGGMMEGCLEHGLTREEALYLINTITVAIFMGNKHE